MWGGGWRGQERATLLILLLLVLLLLGWRVPLLLRLLAEVLRRPVLFMCTGRVSLLLLPIPLLVIAA